MAKSNLVGLKEFRENVEKYARAVARGASYTVLRRSKPVFRIGPVVPEVDEEIREPGWEVLFDATRDNGGKGIRADELLKSLQRMRRHG